ncbi:AAA family ATPase [Nitrosospira sp. Is2]|uniref:bifunctional aminoglycoside phosphotransferase/ATP-binding protein n=1 Tax=Nitrosospira sp. Is2 TaxID=3080532 RepID=UPI0029558B22|nr:AAA family ATPase [Nitrosospira sp. Is2]WON73162.1 AAA family ATPase [Nitrosospira sp. Is2]
MVGVLLKAMVKCSKSHSPTPQINDDLQSRLITALLDGERYPHPAKRVRLVETHISWVLLAGRYAYKIKKSVDLGFLNFTSLARRRDYCDEEIRLNRRLAPRLYLDVIPIGGTLEIPQLGTLPAIEYAVRMRRFSTLKQLDRLAARNKILPSHMDSLAATIARFHAGLPMTKASVRFGTAAATYSSVSKSFERLQGALASHEDETRVTPLRHAMEMEYGKCEYRLEQRHAQGFVRECHGDLHLGNIALIGNQPIPFDCIEFNPSLRWIDLMNEVAFTVMDLLHYQRPDLAFRFLNAYLESTGDYGGVCLLRYYIAYRAVVRAMVSAIRAEQTGLRKRARTAALANCFSLVALAGERLAWHRPALIITHGLPGSGKTTFAQTALERFQAIRIRSDVERKRLFGLTPLADSRESGDAIYTASATQHTYERLHKLARELLMAGNTVIVDAAFLRQSEREYFHGLAHELEAPFAIASLQASAIDLTTRIRRRLCKLKDASEADLAVLKSLQSKQEVLSPAEQAHAVTFLNEGEGFDIDAPEWEKLDRLIRPKNNMNPTTS